ncbi:hypothetical protein N8252_01835 [Ulvibacter sp.]|nr:hypothetical protein [Ulvibacter sp.]
MTAKYLLLLCFLVVSITGFSQDDSNSIESQFIKVVDKSNSYQKYKVIKKTKIEGLRKNVLDTIEMLELKIATSKVEIGNLKSKIELLTKTLDTTKSKLAASIEEEDKIEAIGLVMKKTTYNTLLWSIITGLLGLLGFLFYKHKNGHEITKNTKLRLTEVESDFDAHRKKTLTNEQLLRRKLQDEINKNRTV